MEENMKFILKYYFFRPIEKFTLPPSAYFHHEAEKRVLRYITF